MTKIIYFTSEWHWSRRKSALYREFDNFEHWNRCGAMQ